MTKAIQLRRCMKNIILISLIFVACASRTHQNSDVGWYNDFKMNVDQHNSDSLTTDTCLCRERIFKIFNFIIIDDSLEIEYQHPTKMKHGYLSWDHKPPIMSGTSIMTIDDSCRIVNMEFGE